jgi:hypothetical protein
VHILDGGSVVISRASEAPGAIASVVMRTNPMVHRGVEYSVVQLTDGSGWRWEFRFGDGRSKTGISPVSRAAAIKLVEYEIDRMLKGKE